MYQILLCWRYLRTRYLAFACIVSVMLGVATLIVVNSVMAGFSTKLRERLHGLLSDVVIESIGMDGFEDPESKMAKIRSDPFLGPRVEAMSATMEVFAMMQYHLPDGRPVTRPVRIIGVDAKTRAGIGGFKEHLVHHKSGGDPFEVPPAALARWEQRDKVLRLIEEMKLKELAQANPEAPPPPVPPPYHPKLPHGAVVGHLIATFRFENEKGELDEIVTLHPGDAFVLTTVSGQKLSPVYDSFVVTDYFKSEMSEYDGNYVFVELGYLQHLRTMQDRVTSIQVKLTDYDQDAREIVKATRALFPGERLRIETWEDKQGPLLQAIRIEKGILNVLLFLIVAVAGFGILAIFSMIVAEKTRDIGILKALGASNRGIMRIFLGYGLLLGLVGAGAGSAAGLWLTNNINWVENKVSQVTGQHVFSPKIYYFNEIPTDVQPSAILVVNLGAIAVAVLFSVLPALRAARLHPVQALRYE
jgi:lipoprotein-releasing system permease protein